MRDTGWWQVLLDGLVGAALGGVVAGLTAVYVVRASAKRDRAHAHERAVVRAVADVLAGVSGLLASRQLDPDMRASAWELQASVLALSLELGMWYPEVTEWLDEQGTWITGVTRKVPSDFEEWVVLSRQARRMSAMLTVWARGGMRRWPPSAEFI